MDGIDGIFFPLLMLTGQIVYFVLMWVATAVGSSSTSTMSLNSNSLFSCIWMKCQIQGSKKTGVEGMRSCAYFILPGVRCLWFFYCLIFLVDQVWEIGCKVHCHTHSTRRISGCRFEWEILAIFFRFSKLARSHGTLAKPTLSVELVGE